MTPSPSTVKEQYLPGHCPEVAGELTMDREVIQEFAIDAGANAERARQLSDDAKRHAMTLRKMAARLRDVAAAEHPDWDAVRGFANDIHDEACRAHEALVYATQHAKRAANKSGTIEAAARQGTGVKPKAPLPPPAYFTDALEKGYASYVARRDAARRQAAAPAEAAAR